MMAESTNKIEKHAAQSLHYLNNAFKFLEREDIGKASEFLWGSIAQALKALALTKGITLKKYGRMRDYVIQLTRELRDETVYSVYMNAYALHLNFYEMDMDIIDIRRMAEDVRVLVGKILRLVSEKNVQVDKTVS